VASEGTQGNRQASADVFQLMVTAVPPIPTLVYGNNGVYDGDGISPFPGTAMGLVGTESRATRNSRPGRQCGCPHGRKPS